MKKFLFISLLLFAQWGFAQSTTVSATITDSDGQAWANGTYVISFVPIPGTDSYQWNGSQLTTAQKTISGALSNLGAFSVAVPSNDKISPAGTQWTVTVAPALPAGGASYTTTVTGANLSLTVALSALAKGPRFNANPMVNAYNDTEIADPTAGTFYYNVTLAAAELFDGSAWAAFGSGGGGGNTTSGVLVNHNCVVSSGAHSIVDMGVVCNAFNGASELVQMTAAAKLPAVDASLVTALNPANISVGALANGMTATTQAPGDNTTKVATDAFVLANAGGTPAFSAITTGTNTAALHVGTGGSLDATGTGTIDATSVPAAGVASGALANGMTATTQAPGDNTTKVATDAFVLANAGSGGSSAGAQFDVQFHGPTAGSFAADSGNLTVDVTNHTYNATGGFKAGPDGVHAGLMELYGNTVDPTTDANTVGFIGPNVATFTKYFIQWPSTGPTAAGIALYGAIASNVSAETFLAVGAHQTLVGSAAKTFPPCVDSGGNHLNFDQSTDTISCGTSSSGGGASTAFAGPDTGAANAYNIATLTQGTCPANYAALPIGSTLTFIPANNNTSTTVTMAFCGLAGTKAVNENQDNGPTVNGILATQSVNLFWDGTAWQLTNDANIVGPSVTWVTSHTINTVPIWNSTLGLPGLKPGTITDNGGVTIGSPTGGAQGAGTLNATGLFINGAAVSTGTGCITSGATGGVPKADGAGGCAVSDFINSTSNVFSNVTSTTDTTFVGGQDASANSVLGKIRIRGANQTGAGGASSQGGAAILGGGNNAATNVASQAGSVEIRPGKSTGATQGLQGLVTLKQNYVKGGGTSTLWNLQCFTGTAMTVNDCAASPPTFAGVAETVAANTVETVGVGSQIPVNASAAVTLNHTVCAGATAGQVTDSGGTAPCVSGITVGTVIDVSNTYTLADGVSFTASATLPLVQVLRTQAVGNTLNYPCTPVLNATDATDKITISGTIAGSWFLSTCKIPANSLIQNKRIRFNIGSEIVTAAGTRDVGQVFVQLCTAAPTSSTCTGAVTIGQTPAASNLGLAGNTVSESLNLNCWASTAIGATATLNCVPDGAMAIFAAGFQSGFSTYTVTSALPTNGDLYLAVKLIITTHNNASSASMAHMTATWDGF